MCVLGATPAFNHLGDVFAGLELRQGRNIDGIDTLPEWSKGVDSSSISASCVGSNPTGVLFMCLMK